MSRLLDLVMPIYDPEESWSDKDWRKLYCMHCGAESEYVEVVGGGVVWVTCPSCEREPVPQLKPGFGLAWIAVVAFIVASPFWTFFDTTTAVIAFMATVWFIHNRIEAILGVIIGHQQSEP